jgi:hypothetical protein
MKIVAALIVLAGLSGCAGTGGFVKEATERRQPLAVTTLMPSAANYAGGVSVLMDFTNTSGQSIKYAEFGLVPFNAVGDIVTSTITRESLAVVKYTGPYEPGTSTDDFSVTFNGGVVGFKNVWYNPDIQCVEVRLVRITFMSGATKVFEGQAARELVAPSIRKRCSEES